MATTIREIFHLLACPLCRLSPLVADGQCLRCPGCQERFPECEIESIDFVPRLLPEELESRRQLWEKLQLNGGLMYSLAPELNLFRDEQEITEAFRDFSKLDGLVLDVGCGPQKEIPAYALGSSSILYVGVDPLCGERQRNFPFACALGELLPFRDEIFDAVIFSSCIDHMLDYRKAVEEAFRTLKLGGRICIMADDVTEHGESMVGFRRIAHFVHRGARQLVAAIRRLGLRRATKYLMAFASLRVPKGAVDFFHFGFPARHEILDTIHNKSFHNVRIKPFPALGMVFISAEK